MSPSIFMNPKSFIMSSDQKLELHPFKSNIKSKLILINNII